MSEQWIPGPATPDVEARMEAESMNEDDRVEMRKMVEYLRWRRTLREAREKGEKPPPIPPEMKPWLLGEDAQTKEGV